MGGVGLKYEVFLTYFLKLASFVKFLDFYFSPWYTVLYPVPRVSPD